MGEPPGGVAGATAKQLSRVVDEETAARLAAAWVLIALGIGCLLFGGLFAAVMNSGHNVVATVTREGPCTDVCTVHVVYDADGRQVAAVMRGVPISDLYGPPSHRLLSISYQSGYETDPTTNDMPDAVWIGFLAGGLACLGSGIWLRRWQKARERELTAATAGGPSASAATAAAVTPAVTTIANWNGRVGTVLLVAPGTCLAAYAVFDRPHWARHAPGSAVAAYLAAVAPAAIWLLYRGWRMGARFDKHGVTVRRFLRTNRFGWPEVSYFEDGYQIKNRAGLFWALNAVLRDGQTVTVVTAEQTLTGRSASPRLLAAIRQAAVRHQIPAELTGMARYCEPEDFP